MVVLHTSIMHGVIYYGHLHREHILHTFLYELRLLKCYNSRKMRKLCHNICTRNHIYSWADLDMLILWGSTECMRNTTIVTLAEKGSFRKSFIWK